MGTEIERKFLVNSDIFSEEEILAKGFACYTQITQGYLSTDPTVRVRHSATGPNDAVGHLTVKGKGTLVRREWEYQIPESEAREMLDLCGTVLHKVRYTIPVRTPGFTHLKWEVDKFYDKGLDGLWLAEIELTNPDEGFPTPPWLGKEVTEDPRYSNASLARTHTIPTPTP